MGLQDNTGGAGRLSNSPYHHPPRPDVQASIDAIMEIAMLSW